MSTPEDEFDALGDAPAPKGFDDLLGRMAEFEREHLSTPEGRREVLRLLREDPPFREQMRSTGVDVETLQSRLESWDA